jgi:hypothetical protein
MGTPVLIDASMHLRESEISYFLAASGPKVGPYVLGGKVWVVGNNPFPTAPDNTFIEIFRSDDLGVTFTEADAANHPAAHDRLAATAPPNNGEWRIYDSVLVGTTIYVLYIQPNSILGIIAFNTVANGGLGAWGTTWTGGLAPTVFVEAVLYLQYDPVGTRLVVVYQSPPPSIPPDATFNIFTQTVTLAGVWSGITTVQAYGGVGTIAQLKGIAGGYNALDPLNIFYFTHVFFSTQPSSTTSEFRHRSISSGSGIGASQLLGSFPDAGAGGNANLLVGFPMSSSALNGYKVLVPIWVNNQGGGASDFSIFRSYEATPAAAPVWTAADIFIETTPLTKNFTAIGVGVGGDGTVTLVYSTNNFNYQTRTLVAGAWSAESLFLDITSGPDFNIAQNQISISDGGTIADTGFVLTFGLAGNDTSTPIAPLTKTIYDLNVYSFLVGAAPPPPPPTRRCLQ